MIHGGEGSLSDEEFEAIKEHCINPVDSREAQGEKPETLVTVFDEPADVKIFDGFKDMEESKLKELYDSLGLAMTFKDFQHIQNYFKSYNILDRTYRRFIRRRRLQRADGRDLQTVHR